VVQKDTIMRSPYSRKFTKSLSLTPLSSFEVLSLQVKYSIFAYLDVPSLCKLRLSNKRMNTIIHENLERTLETLKLEYNSITAQKRNLLKDLNPKEKALYEAAKKKTTSYNSAIEALYHSKSEIQSIRLWANPPNKVTKTLQIVFELMGVEDATKDNMDTVWKLEEQIADVPKFLEKLKKLAPDKFDSGSRERFYDYVDRENITVETIGLNSVGAKLVLEFMLRGVELNEVMKDLDPRPKMLLGYEEDEIRAKPMMVLYVNLLPKIQKID